jgi:hypothetical protein
MHGNNTRKLPVQLSLSQISKNVMFFFLSFLFLLLQSWRTEYGTGAGGGMALLVRVGRWQEKGLGG